MSRVGNCTNRDCGNNPNRKVNPNDYDSVMGFLCDPCEDEADEQKGRGFKEWCDICGERLSLHETPCVNEV